MFGLRLDVLSAANKRGLVVVPLQLRKRPNLPWERHPLSKRVASGQ